MMNDFGEKLILVDDQNEEHEFSVLDFLEVDGLSYVVIMPLEDDEGDETGEAEALIMRIDEDDNGDDVFVCIDSDEEWQKVVDAYNESLFEE